MLDHQTSLRQPCSPAAHEEEGLPDAEAVATAVAIAVAVAVAVAVASLTQQKR